MLEKKSYTPKINKNRMINTISAQFKMQYFIQEMLTVIQEVSFSEYHFPPGVIMCVFSTLLSAFIRLCIACMSYSSHIQEGESVESQHLQSVISQFLDFHLHFQQIPQANIFATVLRSILNILFETKYKRSDHLQSIKIPWLLLQCSSQIPL